MEIKQTIEIVIDDVEADVTKVFNIAKEIVKEVEDKVEGVADNTANTAQLLVEEGKNQVTADVAAVESAAKSAV